MRRIDEERAARRNRRTNATSRRITGSSEQQASAPRILHSSTDRDAALRNLRNPSGPLTDTFGRLQQIRNTLSYLETNMVHPDASGQQSTLNNSTSSDEPLIGPTHSAILLSEGSGSATVDTDALRNRLDEAGAELPEYMHATANMIQNLTRTRGTMSQAQNAEDSPNGSTIPEVQLTDHLAESSGNATLDSASGRYVRPRRESNPARGSGAGQLRQENHRDSEATNSFHAWRAAYRDDDSANTLLGRRVASRAAAAAAARTSPVSADRHSRVIPSSSLLWPEHTASPVSVAPTPGLMPYNYLSSVPIPSAPGLFTESYGFSSAPMLLPPEPSRVIVPPRMPNRVRRRIALFESAASELEHRDDSDGSETEVDNYVFRRPNIYRRGSDNGLQARSSIQERTDSTEPPLSVLNVIPVSPPAREIYSMEPSSSDTSPQTAEEERPATTSPRMQNSYGLLIPSSDSLSETPDSILPSSTSSERGDLDSTLVVQRTDGRQERFSLYQVADEEEGRSYRIRRRINADGDEQVHQINANDWWDDGNFVDPFFPSTSTAASRETRISSILGDNERLLLAAATNPMNANISMLDRLRGRFNTRTYGSQSQRSETDLPALATEVPAQTTQIVTRRRRGWARLDANGDEIPTDEEEEIERVRTEQRIRNSHTSWRSASTRLEYLAPTTRSVFSHATDEDEGDENDVRIRLNLPPAQPARRSPNARFSVFSDARKEKGTAPESMREFFGTSEPYYISPFPMPVEEILPFGSLTPSEFNDTPYGPADLCERPVAGR